MKWLVPAALVTVPLSAAAQQRSDDAFRFANPNPAFATGAGPTVCIDEGHFNFHTADGRYKPFADLLRGDGYEVARFTTTFTARALARCTVLIVANPLAEANEEDWNFPHPSAFTSIEMRVLMEWVRGGGHLLLFADHAPIAGAARDLAAVFGVVMTDVYADGMPGGPDVFRLADNTLRRHPIVSGRTEADRVERVTTFTGQAFQITGDWQPLLVFGPEAIARINLGHAFQAGTFRDYPSFSVAGWTHGATRVWDAGRVVFLGEAAMCSAQVSGPNRSPMGMNHPEAPQNVQFCLNVVRWLTGVIR